MLVHAKHRGFSTSKREINDIVRAWLFLSLAFTIAVHGVSPNLDFFINIFISLLTVGIGFVLHELAHKIVAQHYGCFAEFRSFDSMLWFALLISFTGFFFAAPGAVMISGPIGTRRNGVISVAGPVTNLVLAIGFLVLAALFPGTVVALVGLAGAQVNTWLALFNMIPIWMLDGRKVWVWNKAVYFMVLGAGLVLFFFGAEFVA